MGMRAIVIDTGAAKKKLSLDMGAEEFIDFKEVSDVAAEVKRVAGGVGAHGVIVTAYQAYTSAISYIADRIGGVIMCVGLRRLSNFRSKWHANSLQRPRMLSQLARILHTFLFGT